MNNILIIDSLKIAGQAIVDSLKIGQAIEKYSDQSQNINCWKWLAIAEFGIIVFLILRKKFKHTETAKRLFKQESLEQEIDFKNIIDSSFNSIQLYDELKVKCHPDLFSTDKEKNAIAENLFKEIVKGKTNVKRLLELKEEAIQKLNINI
jgi:hypothetical protein